jgi:hypothetical protein
MHQLRLFEMLVGPLQRLLGIRRCDDLDTGRRPSLEISLPAGRIRQNHRSGARNLSRASLVMHPNQIVKTFDRFDLQIVRQRNFSPRQGTGRGILRSQFLCALIRVRSATSCDLAPIRAASAGRLAMIWRARLGPGAQAVRGDAASRPRSEAHAPSPREIAQRRPGTAARDDRVPLAHPTILTDNDPGCQNTPRFCYQNGKAATSPTRSGCCRYSAPMRSASLRGRPVRPPSNRQKSINAITDGFPTALA